MKEFFTGLFEYTRFMNNELIRSIREHREQASDKSLKWINHILNAHQRWNCRVRKDPAMPGTWDMHSLDELERINETNFQTSIAIIQNTELGTIIEYAGPNGGTHKNAVRDMLFHIVNHSTYHRGQIATDFRQTGLEPLETDYDAYLDSLKS